MYLRIRRSKEKKKKKEGLFKRMPNLTHKEHDKHISIKNDFNYIYIYIPRRHKYIWELIQSVVSKLLMLKEGYKSGFLNAENLK